MKLKIKKASEIQENNTQRYIVIEDFNDNISLVIDPESGDTLVFDNYNDAEEEAEKCQNGKVFKL